uniref:NB-ARC domain-containing protein n=1 Tax=Oryza barthii TaxID=65489 RepID=A0A0D3G0I0_9ORYZ
MKLARNPKLSTSWEFDSQDQQGTGDQAGDLSILSGLEWLETDDFSVLTMSFFKHLNSLRHLTLSSSRSYWRVVRLSEGQGRVLQQLTHLQELRFLCCDDLLVLPEQLHSFINKLSFLCQQFASLIRATSTYEALLAFKKAVTTSDGIFLNWREQDVYPCNWKVVRCHSHTKRVACFFHSHYKSGQSSTYQKNGLCLKTFPNRAIICVVSLQQFGYQSILLLGCTEIFPFWWHILYFQVISSINVKIIKNNPQLNRQDKRYTPMVPQIHHVPGVETGSCIHSGDSNFLDLEWLSASGNSSDERSIAISTPDVNLSAENNLYNDVCKITHQQHPLQIRTQPLLEGGQVKHQGLASPQHVCLIRSARRKHQSHFGRMPESRQLWWLLLSAIGRPECLPVNEISFHSWLCDKRETFPSSGFDTIDTLAAWTIWKERNNRVFNQKQRSWTEVARAMAEEAALWRLANIAMPAMLLGRSGRNIVWNTVGQAAIGWLVESVLGSLFTDKLSSWLRRVNLDNDVEELVSEMRNVAVVLEAAKGMKVGDQNEPMAVSLLHLKDLLYDAEDVLDKLDYRRLHEQITKGNNEDVTSPPTSYFVSITRWFTVTGWKRKREENHTHLDNKIQFSATIKQIAGKLRDACGDVSKGLKINGLKSPEASNLRHQSTARATNATTSYLLEPKVYGRAVEVESIKKLILTNRSKGITVVPIVGNGGMGKTTLAQLVYKDPAVGSQFDVMIWVHVSDKFDMVRVTREILECVSKKQEASNFNMLQQDLEEQMRYKKFLIVLDDVWDVRKDDWKKLLAPLRPNNHVDPSQKEATCKMIIITTRIQSVAESLGTEQLIKLQALEDDDIWSLFKKHAFGNDKHDSYPTLQNLGRIIVKELNGNPLAAKTVGALLGRNLTIDHWSSIIENKEWQSLQRTDNGIMHALKLSYDHLPNQLQQCFSYCSLFPKGYSFSEAQLVQIWIAQGFVEKSSEKLERKGVEYLEELVNSGFFQQVKSMRSSSKDFVMHDLMHDLARMVSKTECATIDSSEWKELASSIRHLSIVTDSVYHEDKYGKISRNEEFEKRLLNVRSRSKLRTLVLIGKYDPHFFQSFREAFKEAQHLRLLHITSTYDDFGSFLSRLVNSTHLRYLRLENDEFGALPQALSNCYHLQVLDIGSCGIPSSIPIDINNLVNLRHLVGEDVVFSRIACIGNMTSLQELTNFKVQNSTGFEIAQIQSMSELVELGVSQLKNITRRDEACGARLRDKQNLEKLHLSWMGAMSQDGYNSDKSYDNEYETEHFPDIAREVLHGLEPHHKLKHLRISGFNGATSPTWLLSSLTCLQTLHLENCGKWQILPLERLLLLRKLVLIKMENATEVSIPSLEELVLIELPRLKTWSCTSVRDLNFSLRCLNIKYCPLLKVLSLFENCQQFEVERKSWLPHLSQLTIHSCPHFGVHNTLPPSHIVSKLSIAGVSTLPTVKGSSSGTLRIGHPDVYCDSSDEGSDQLITLDDKVLSFHSLRFLTELVINGCQNLTSISFGSLRQLICLRSLSIYNCPELFSSNVPLELAHEDEQGANRNALPSLEHLYIMNCEITGKWLSLMLQQAQALRALSLLYCNQITRLSIEGEQSTEDSSTSSSDQDGLLRIPLNLVSSLKNIFINNCCDMTFNESMEGFSRFTSLEQLRIGPCPKLLTSLVNNNGYNEQENKRLLPLSLQELELSFDDLAEKLLPGFLRNPNPICLKKLLVLCGTNLKSLELQSCVALEELDIIDCESLATLEGLQSLSSLRYLNVFGCPDLPAYLESLSGKVPELCPRLEKLHVGASTLTTSFCKHLTSLQFLRLNSGNEEVARLTDEQERALQLLSSLQELQFDCCHKLVDLPTVLHSLLSLKRLEISSCRSITKLPEKGLPTSLQELDISYCSKELTDQCIPLSSKMKVKIRRE